MEKLNIKIEEKLFKDFPQTRALDKISFGIKNGEFVCVLGPSGSGKTTLLRLISGLDKDYRGEITINNSKQAIENECAIVFQEPRLLPWMNVEENLKFGLNEEKTEIIEKKLQEALELLKLEEFSKSFPTQLSGGMNQKVALSRAMIRKPGLLLLDEPFASLDALTKMQLQEELSKIVKKEKTTAIMVTHDIEEAVFLADRIIILSERPGKIIADYKIKLQNKDRTTNEFRQECQKILKTMLKKK
jgi:sulfonate transport system ATP-binding protein